jgi:ankyrin repeat protein
VIAPDPDDGALFEFFRAIAERDSLEPARALDASPRFASTAIRVAASRADPETYFLDSIRHHVYAGDTALHIAAASYQRPTAELLVAHGAPVRARNRRGAEPLHYAVDGSPGGARWDPDAQRSVVEYLIEAGADPNACDDSGVGVLHRAVRTRCSEAVRALLERGGEPRQRNKRGSTPLHLAVQTTGRSDSGTDAAREEQRRIIELLLQYGAAPTDEDAKGKTVVAASSSWIRDLLS